MRDNRKESDADDNDGDNLKPCANCAQNPEPAGADN